MCSASIVVTTAIVGWSVRNDPSDSSASATRKSPCPSRAFDPSPVPKAFGDSALPLALRPGSYRANAQDVFYLKPFLLAQSERYGTLKPPIRILHGGSDQVVGLEIHSRALTRAAPDARLEVVPGAGHLLHYVAPDRVVATIDQLAADTR